MTVTSIDPVADFSGANSSIFNVVRDHGSDMPTAVYSTVSNYFASPVDRVVNTAEALYAAAKAASAGPAQEEFCVACVQLADFCVANQFHALGQTDRGTKIAGACRRIVGLGSQSEADDPAVLDTYT